MGETPSKTLSNRPFSPERKKRAKKSRSPFIGCLVRTGSDIFTINVMEHDERTKRLDYILNQHHNDPPVREEHHEDLSVSDKKTMKSFNSVPVFRPLRSVKPQSPQIGNNHSPQAQSHIVSNKPQNISLTPQPEQKKKFFLHNSANNNSHSNNNSHIHSKTASSSNSSYASQTSGENTPSQISSGGGTPNQRQKIISRLLNDNKEKDLIVQEDHEISFADNSYNSDSEDSDYIDKSLIRSKIPFTAPNSTPINTPGSSLKFAQAYGNTTPSTSSHSQDNDSNDGQSQEEDKTERAAKMQLSSSSSSSEESKDESDADNSESGNTGAGSNSSMSEDPPAFLKQLIHNFSELKNLPSSSCNVLGKSF